MSECLFTYGQFAFQVFGRFTVEDYQCCKSISQTILITAKGRLIMNFYVHLLTVMRIKVYSVKIESHIMGTLKILINN